MAAFLLHFVSFAREQHCKESTCDNTDFAEDAVYSVKFRRNFSDVCVMNPELVTDNHENAESEDFPVWNPGSFPRRSVPRCSGSSSLLGT
jgi:hypothetical protein